MNSYRQQLVPYASVEPSIEYILISQKQAMKTNNILILFSHFTFTSAAQSLLSSLEPAQLRNLLSAIEDRPIYSQLTQLVRARLFVAMAEEIDRTFYFTHYEEINQEELKQQRGNMVARNISRIQLKSILQKEKEFTQKGNTFFEDTFPEIRSALFDPELQLPPFRRQTVAPNCQTVYQIVLACRALNLEDEFDDSLPYNSETCAFFVEGLSLQIEIANTYLSSITEDYEHFAELTYRFMVYRNTVLSLHHLCPFPVLSQTMALWASKMHHHYIRANKIFVKLMNLGDQQQFTGYGLLSKNELKAEGYMMDYIEGLVDLSVNEDTVGFSGHSKQIFGTQYQLLQKQILSSMVGGARFSLEELKERVEEWKDEGVKPCTLLKICQLFEGSEEICEEICCSADSFIQNCGRINGLTMPSEPIHWLSC